MLLHTRKVRKRDHSRGVKTFQNQQLRIRRATKRKLVVQRTGASRGRTVDEPI